MRKTKGRNTKGKKTGGDNSISNTMGKVSNIVSSIGNTAGKIPVVGEVVKPIADVFSDVYHGIGSAFSWLGLGAHIHHLESHLGLPHHLTQKEIDQLEHIDDDGSYFRKIRNLGKSTAEELDMELPPHHRHFFGAATHILKMKESQQIPEDPELLNICFENEKSGNGYHIAGKYKIAGDAQCCGRNGSGIRKGGAYKIAGDDWIAK